MDRRKFIARLARRDRLPWPTLSYCLDNPDHCIPAFLLLLERRARDLEITPDERRALYFGIHLLASFKVVETFKLLIRNIDGSSDQFEELTGDAIGDTIPQVLMAVGAGQAEACWKAALNTNTDWIVREAFLRCWTYEVLCGQVDRQVAAHCLREFPERAALAPDSFLWAAWMTAIADLGLSELIPSVQRLLAEGHVSQGPCSLLPDDLAVFHQDLSDARSASSDEKLFSNWLRKKQYHPFEATYENFVRAGRHVLKEDPTQSSTVNEPALLAADRKVPFDDSPQS